MRSVADDDQPLQTVGAGNHGNAARRFFGVAAFGLGNDGFFGNAHGHQVFAAHRAFVVLVAAVAAQGDDQRSNAALIEGQGVVQPGAVDRRGPSVVLRRAKDANRVRRRSLVLTRRSSQSARRPSGTSQRHPPAMRAAAQTQRAESSCGVFGLARRFMRTFQSRD